MLLERMSEPFKEALRNIRDLKQSDSSDFENQLRGTVFSVRDAICGVFDGEVSKGFANLVVSFDEKGNDFYTAPASTHFHGAFKGGLALHSLKVLRRVFLLAPLMLPESQDIFEAQDYYYYAVAAIAHDLCKLNMYGTDYRNVKNEQTGQWEKKPYYKFRDDYVAAGHGFESLLRLQKYVQLPRYLELAVVHHMGAYGLSSDSGELATYRNAVDHCPEVLLYHTADMLAATQDGA